jgi:hypothetical protein
MQLPTIREYGSEYLYMEWVGGRPWDKTCVDIMERHGFAIERGDYRFADIRRWLVPKDQLELAHHCLFTLQGYKRRLEGTVDCFSCRGAYDAIHCFVCEWDQGPPPEMLVKLACERGITVDRAQIEDFINRVPSMAPAFPDKGFALTPNSEGRISAWFRDESLLNTEERDHLAQWEGHHAMENTIWDGVRRRAELKRGLTITGRVAQSTPTPAFPDTGFVLTPNSEGRIVPCKRAWWRDESILNAGERDLLSQYEGDHQMEGAIWDSVRTRVEREHVDAIRGELSQERALQDATVIRDLRRELGAANARIRMLKLEIGPSAVESAKPKSTVVIHCQSEEDPL